MKKLPVSKFVSLRIFIKIRISHSILNKFQFMCVIIILLLVGSKKEDVKSSASKSVKRVFWRWNKVKKFSQTRPLRNIHYTAWDLENYIPLFLHFVSLSAFIVILKVPYAPSFYLGRVLLKVDGLWTFLMGLSQEMNSIFCEQYSFEALALPIKGTWQWGGFSGVFAETGSS